MAKQKSCTIVFLALLASSLQLVAASAGDDFAFLELAIQHPLQACGFLLLGLILAFIGQIINEKCNGGRGSIGVPFWSAQPEVTAVVPETVPEVVDPRAQPLLAGA